MKILFLSKSFFFILNNHQLLQINCLTDSIFCIAINVTNLKWLILSNPITKYEFKTKYALFNRLHLELNSFRLSKLQVMLYHREKTTHIYLQFEGRIIRGILYLIPPPLWTGFVIALSLLHLCNENKVESEKSHPPLFFLRFFRKQHDDLVS